MDPKQHWEAIYRQRKPEEVSWFQREATLSLELIRGVADATAAVLDVGGGASTLVDGLVRTGYRNVSVLDLSAAALEAARHRLGAAASLVTWREADVLTAEFEAGAVDVWHDRAVFHFLIQPAERERYIAQVRHAVHPGGHVVVATFADDGPTRCSGLPVARYSAADLHGEFGRDFRLLVSRREMHETPRGARQAFVYCLCRYEPTASVRSAA